MATRGALAVVVPWSEVQVNDIVCSDVGEPWVMVASIETLGPDEVVVRASGAFRWGDLRVSFREPGDAGGWLMYRHPDETTVLDLGSRMREAD